MKKSVVVTLAVINLFISHRLSAKSFIPSLQRIRAKVEKVQNDTQNRSFKDVITAKNSNPQNIVHENNEQNELYDLKSRLVEHDELMQLILTIEFEVLSDYWNEQSDFLKKFRQLITQYPASAINLLKKKLMQRYADYLIEKNPSIIRLQKKLLFNDH